MWGHCTPGHRYFELCIEVTPEVGAHSLVGEHLNQPVFAEVAEILVVIEEEVEGNFLHDGRSAEADQNLVGIEPVGLRAWVGMRQVQFLGGGSAIGGGVDNGHYNVNHLFSGFIESR